MRHNLQHSLLQHYFGLWRQFEFRIKILIGKRFDVKNVKSPRLDERINNDEIVKT